MQAQKTHWLDRVQERIVSRKFLVWIVASCFYLWAGLPADIWGLLTGAYLGSQAVLDGLAARKKTEYHTDNTFSSSRNKRSDNPHDDYPENYDHEGIEE